MRLAALIFLAMAPAALAATPMYEEEPISYSKTAPNDAVARLNEAIGKGEVQLTPHESRGYLDSLLKSLDISPSSQALLFSKTSLQARLINPKRPRALYFNDDTYVGYVPGGGLLEVASIDPVLGSVFYSINQRGKGTIDAAAHAQSPALRRQTETCLQCHGDSMTNDLPGLVLRSVFTDADGVLMLQAGTFRTTHESPLSERWGGWYVTGATGGQKHLGNTQYTIEDGKDPQPTVAATTDLTDVASLIDTSGYPTPHSDIVALLVLEHQVEAHNRMTAAAHGTLRALRDEKVIADAMGETLQPGEHSESTLGRIKSSCEPLVEYLLFSGETKLSAAVGAGSAFAVEFSARGPRDDQGRSLRDLDLKTRLLRYPCSYLIYARSMDGLPDAAKQYVFRRLWEVLSGKESGKAYAHLTAADRSAVMEILRQTKPALRDAWAKLQ